MRKLYPNEWTALYKASFCVSPLRGCVYFMIHQIYEKYEKFIICDTEIRLILINLDIAYFFKLILKLGYNEYEIFAIEVVASIFADCISASAFIVLVVKSLSSVHAL